MVVMVLTHGKPILVVDGMIFMSSGCYLKKKKSVLGRITGPKWDLGVGVLGHFF